jgi:tetratricopeptide (TPR) repeat protein
MTDSFWQSAFVAALFALHPLHIESVACVSERKDVLSAFFWLLTMLCYVKYVRSSKLINYLLSILFFVLGLMSKPMLVTLPFVLLLLDFWPLKRIINHNEINKLYSQQKSSIRLIILEKVPFFIITALSIYITLYFQQKCGAIAYLDTYPLSSRISNALLSYVLYLWKIIYPCNLAVYYPYPELLPWWQVTGAFLLISAISIASFRTLKSHPFLCTGWLWYLGTLVPVIGLVQVGSQAMADRYTYIPLIGIYIIIAWCFPAIFKGLKHKKKFIIGLAVIYFLLLISIARVQTGYWKNSTTLFGHTVLVTTDNSTAHLNLGIALDLKGLKTEAMNHYIETLRILPDQPKARNNLALILTSHGRPDEAINHFNEILRLHPDDAIAHNNLGTVFHKKGKVVKALFHFNEAVRIKPDYSDARYNRDMLRAVLKKNYKNLQEKNRAEK